MEAYGDEFDQKLAAAFGAKNPPDVMYMWNYPSYFQSLEPLDNFIKKDPTIDLNDFYQGLFNYSTMYRKLYGMPAGFTTRVVYYNKDLFDAAGIPYPQDGWTWDDFKSVAKKLSNPAMEQYGFGVRPEPDTYDLQGIVWSNGSSFISEDGKKLESYMNSPETIESIEIFADMVKQKAQSLLAVKINKVGKRFLRQAGLRCGKAEFGPWRSLKRLR